ncbi:MAG: protein kinase [Acidimicrobiales bacterium]
MTTPPAAGPSAGGPSSGSGPPLAGRHLAGRYRFGRPVASGGMATVWEAQDETLTRPVAIKVLHTHLAADHSFVTRFRAEAISAARLSHPSIVSIYDTWSGDGLEAIVMELVRGTTLRHLLDQRGPLPVAEAVTIANHIAAALEAAHRGGIVHRDIKPANVLLSTDGRVLVTDFGIAKATEGADLTTEQTMLGTAKYLAPEQVESGPVDGRTDLYALGVVLYEMLCGRVPFQAETEAATALARLHRRPDPPSSHRPELPPMVEAIVLCCLARAPEDRYPDAGAVRLALASADIHVRPASTTPAAGADRAPPPPVVAQPPSPGFAAPPPAPPIATRHGRRSRTGWLLMGGLVLVAMVVAGTLALRIATRVDRRPRPVAIATAKAFDPFAGDGEHDGEAALAVDGEADTAWNTETYRQEALGKPGVGLVLRLRGKPSVGSVTVLSPSTGWSASIYTVEADPGGDLDSWGRAVTSQERITAGTSVLRFEDRRATAVLLWITALGPNRRVTVSDVSLSDA